VTPLRRSDRPRFTVEHVRFAQEDPAALVRRATDLAAAHAGWITMRPEVRETRETEPVGMFAALLSDRRFEIPLCSWVVGPLTRKGPRPFALGVQHSTGTHAVGRLADRGVNVAAGWRTVQDHPRRGLVVEAPLTCPEGDMISWLLRAGSVLSQLEVTGRWDAEVHARG